MPLWPRRRMGEESRQRHQKVLMNIVREQGRTLEPRRLEKLLLWIQEKHPRYPADGSYELSEWQKVARLLLLRQEFWEDVDADNFFTWWVVYEALHDFRQTDRALPPALTELLAEVGSEKILQGAEQKSSAAQPPPCALRMTEADASGDRAKAAGSSFLKECQRKALEEGDMELFQALKVTYWGPQLPRCEQLTYDFIKVFRKSVKTDGLKGKFPMGMVEYVAYTYRMAPADWKFIFKVVMNAEEYAVWMKEYTELCIQQAQKNMASKIAVDFHQLMGEDQFGTSAAQAQMSKEISKQATQLALQALEKVPEEKGPSFWTIIQGPQEPYLAFLDRLCEALSRQVKVPEAVEVLLMHLAVEHANADCRRILELICLSATKVVDLIEAWTRFGIVQYEAEQLAKAFQPLRLAEVQCSNCGQEGHVKRQCPEGTLGAAQTPPGPCPRCQKGFHWRNQCRSKFDRDGNRLPKSGRSKRGARCGAPQ